MQFWCAARLMTSRETLALHCLGLAGYLTYCRGCGRSGSRMGAVSRSVRCCFPAIASSLSSCSGTLRAGRRAPGTLGLIMAGDGPARVPKAVIAEIRSRERNGLSSCHPDCGAARV
jgi:hypothetical protein